MATMTAKETEQILTSLAGMNRASVEAIDGLLDLKEVKAAVTTRDLLSKIKGVLEAQGMALGVLAACREAAVIEELKAAFGGVLGSLAALYGQLRTQPAARAVRDTYTALSHLSMCYLGLQTHALTLGDLDVAKLAQDHFAELTDLQVALSDEMTAVTHQVTALQHNKPLDPALIEHINRSAHKAWSS